MESTGLTELEDGIIWSKKEKVQDLKKFEKHQMFAVVGYIYEEGSKTKYTPTGDSERDIPVAVIAQRWRLQHPKLIIRINGSLEKVSNRAVFLTQEFLTRLIKVVTDSETWLIIESDSKTNTLLETLGSALHHARKKEIKEIPVIAAFALDKLVTLNEEELKSYFIEDLDYYLFLSPSQRAFISDKTTYLESFLLCNERENKRGPVIYLKGTGGFVDDIEDLDILSQFMTLDISKPVEDLPIEETILKSLQASETWAIDNEPKETQKTKTHLNKTALLQCVRFNQLAAAVELWDLWRLPKDNSELSVEVAKEAVRFKRYNFIEYLLDKGLNPCCFQDTQDDKINKRKKTRKQIKIDKLVKHFCHLPESSNNEPSETCYEKKDSKIKDAHDKAQLFKDKILAREYHLTLLLLPKIENPTGAALYAYGMLKAMRQCSNSDEEREKINEQMEKFQNEAIKTINRTYIEKPEQTMKLLGQNLPLWGHMTCIILALRTGNKKFLASPPCKEFQKRMWRTGHIFEDNFWDCKDCDFVTHSPQHIKANLECPQCSSEITEHKVDRLRYFLSPTVLVFLKFTSHILFLLLYAMLLVSVLETDFHWLEWVIWSWIVTGIAEQINQNIRNPLNNVLATHQLRVFDWIEFISLLLFVFAWLCLRLVAHYYPENTDLMSWARVFFSIDYIGFSLGLLEVCYSHKFLGPIMLMMMRMTKTLIQFIIIVMIFCLAYAIASESVLYPTSQMNPKLAFYVMRKAFWAMFADFNLDEINGDSCTNNSEIYRTYEQTRCPTTVGKYYVPPLMGIYYIIVNILLFNLLIAMFNFKISVVWEKAEEIWHHQKMQLIFKYCKVIILPPPFTLLSPLLIVCRAKGIKDPFTQSVQDHEAKRLQRLQVAAQKKTNKEENQTILCNGIVACPHKDLVNETKNELEKSKKPKPLRIDASSQTDRMRKPQASNQIDTPPSHKVSTQQTAGIEKPTPRPQDPVPTDSKMFVVTEETVIIEENRHLTGSVNNTKSDERRQPLPERKYYAV